MFQIIAFFIITSGCIGQLAF